ncbi:Eco29kI family restriction endonuclease, partial [Vibrio parahaemolyticus]
VGKAIPAGGRIGATGNNEIGQELFRRLGEHAESIKAATNLEITDFTCQYLVVEHLLIALAEHTLINQY